MRKNNVDYNDVKVCPPPSASYCVEVAHRSEHGAAAGRAELRHQRPAHLVLRAHQRLCPLPICHTKTALPAADPLQGQLSCHWLLHIIYVYLPCMYYCCLYLQAYGKA